jgi:hypothetical protein
LIAGAFGLVFCIGVAVLIPSLPGLAAQTAGMSAAGSLDGAFAVPPIPPPVLTNATQPDAITVMLADYGSQTIVPQAVPLTVAVGTTDDGGQAVSVSISERDLLALCQQRSDLCALDPRFQNPTVDLRPGGAVIYGDVTLAALGGLQQRIGIATRLEGNRLNMIGVDIGGTLYTNPPTQFAESINNLEQLGTELLQRLSLQADGQTFTLNAVHIDETMVTLILR